MIKEIIENKFPNNNAKCSLYKEHLCKVCNEFIERGLADPKYLQEISSGVDAKFWSCLSEALFAHFLHGKEFPPRTQKGEGPDFLVLSGRQRVWIEVICPEPSNLPVGWMNHVEGVIDFPHKEILLRWTSAIKAKAEQLLGTSDGKKPGYLETGIVAPSDAYVIAVNACQLRGRSGSNLFGISQFPFAAEAVFPIGPYQLKLNKDTLEVVDRGHQHRPIIMNQNNSPVPAYTFLNPQFNNISAIWAADMNGGTILGNSEPLAVIHNPNAKNKISQGILPADFEYIASPINNEELVLEKYPGTICNKY